MSTPTTEPDEWNGQDEILGMLCQDAPDCLLPNGNPHSLDDSAVLQSSDPKRMTAKFVIVTRQAAPNLHGNKVRIVETSFGQGLRTELHKPAPIVLFEHGYGMPYPIGVSRTPNGEYTVKLHRNKAVAEVFFSQQLPEAEQIFRLVDEGTIQMASIGFIPTKAMRFRADDDDETAEGVEDLRYGGGFDFTESLLLEWSVVARGADPGAFRQMLDRGHVTHALRPVFQNLAGEKPAWTPGASFTDGRVIVNVNQTKGLDVSEVVDVIDQCLVQESESASNEDVEAADRTEAPIDEPTVTPMPQDVSEADVTDQSNATPIDAIVKSSRNAADRVPEPAPITAKTLKALVEMAAPIGAQMVHNAVAKLNDELTRHAGHRG